MNVEEIVNYLYHTTVALRVDKLDNATYEKIKERCDFKIHWSHHYISRLGGLKNV